MGQLTTPPRFRLGYRPALDGLRAVAIILVMAYHAQVGAFQGGYLGVDLFFVLSGFLITTLLVQEIQQTGTIQIRRFYKRRFLRLFPALAFLMVAYLSVGALDPTVFTYALWRAGIVLGYISNWVIAFDIMALNLISHTWSLAIEEQFYIFFPLLLGVLIPRLKWQALRTLLLAGIGVVCLLRLGLWVSGVEWYRLYYGTDTRADALLWGCWLAVTLSTTTTWRTSFWAIWARKALFPALVLLALFVVMAKVGNVHHYSWVFPLVALISTLLIFHLVTAPRGRIHQILESSPLVRIGKISYGLYLWHHPIYTILFWLGMSEVLVLLIGTPITFGITLFSYYVVEQPFLRHLRHMATAPVLNTDRLSTSMVAVQQIEG